MQQREKLLAGGLGAVVLFWGALSVYDKQITVPLKEKDDQLLLAQEDSQKSMAAWKGLIKDQKLIRDSVRDSLPPDGQDAQRVYLKWVLELAELSGWKEISPNKNLDARSLLGKIGVRVPVTLTARAKLRQIAQFLWHFERAALLQRITSLQVTSPSSDGDPDLTVVVTVEGLALSQAPSRKRLFPVTGSTSAIDSQSTSMTVGEATGFPASPPFRIRIESEYATVSAIDGSSWTLIRAVDDTLPTPHAAGANIEYAPTRSIQAENDAGLAKYTHLLERSGFIKPVPIVEFKPKLATSSLPVVTRGDSWSVDLRVEGWNPSWEAPRFELSGQPAGLIFTPAGHLEWKVPDDVPAGEFIIHVTAKSSDQVQLNTPVTLTLREKNRPPQFSPIGPLRAYIGRTLQFPVVATDADTKDRLIYALSGQPPQGLAIDGSSGMITWTPPETLEAGDVRFQVTATDNGTPPLTSTQDVAGQLDDDHAEYTFLVGYIEKGGARQALLNDRLTNMTTPVSVGDKWLASDLDWVVDAIDADGMTFRQGAVRLRVDLGSPLRAAQRLPPAPLIPPPPPDSKILEKPLDAARD